MSNFTPFKTGQKFAKPKQSDGKTRPTRCLSQCYSTHRHMEISNVLLGQQPMQIPMSFLFV